MITVILLQNPLVGIAIEYLSTGVVHPLSSNQTFRKKLLALNSCAVCCQAAEDWADSPKQDQGPTLIDVTKGNEFYQEYT